MPLEGAQPRPTLQLQTGLRTLAVQVAGTVSAPGAPLAVMDIGAAQDLLGRVGQLTRIDLQLQPATDRSAFRQALQALPGWPAQATLAEPGDAAQRVSNLSRAYRVNLTVLALVALFTGAFLVFSVLALSVAQRGPQFALLAVLGATPRQRLALVLAKNIDSCEDARLLPQLAKQYRDTIREIEEMEGAPSDDDQVGAILAQRQQDGKPGAVRTHRSGVPEH